MNGGVSARRQGETAALGAPLGLAGLGTRPHAVVGTTLLLILVASAQGGYFPPSWSWTALALAWVIGLWAVVGARHELGLLDVAMLGALSAFLLWIVSSAGWSSDPAQSLLEAQRGLVYVTGVAAFLLLSRRHAVSALACAITAAISLEALYALATRLFPDRLGAYDPIAVYRLSGSIGYWNGLGIFCVLGILLSLGLVLHSRPAVRVSAAVALVVLLPTLYFTFSRGSWVALGIGAAALFLGNRERLRMITAAFVVLPAPAVAVFSGRAPRASPTRARCAQPRLTTGKDSRSRSPTRRDPDRRDSGLSGARPTRTARADAQASLQRRPARRDRRRRVVRLCPVR